MHWLTDEYIYINLLAAEQVVAFLANDLAAASIRL